MSKLYNIWNGLDKIESNVSLERVLEAKEQYKGLGYKYKLSAQNRNEFISQMSLAAKSDLDLGHTRVTKGEDGFNIKRIENKEEAYYSPALLFDSNRSKVLDWIKDNADFMFRYMELSDEFSFSEEDFVDIVKTLK